MSETTPNPEAADDEPRRALRYALVILAILTLVKAIGHLPFIGTIAFTFAAAAQLYLPLWRCESRGLSYAYVGLHWQAWKKDLRYVLILSGIIFPPYIFLHHWFLTQAHGFALKLPWPEVARFIPHMVYAPKLPQNTAALVSGAGWLIQMVLTHFLGVALPEETFYRGYLQEQLQKRWPAAKIFFSVPLGKAALLAAFLFALGHYLGEWNPLRLGPFFPALIFAWQKNASGSILGCIAFHALCNIVGELLFVFYRPF